MINQFHFSLAPALRGTIWVVCAVLLTGCGQEWPISVRDRAALMIEGFGTDVRLDSVEKSDGYRTLIVPDNVLNKTHAADTTRDWSLTAERVALTNATPVLGEFMVGSTVAYMSNPGEPGMWLKTHLVSEERQGRLVFPQTARSVFVTLRPLDVHKTNDSQISYAAMKGLSVQMTTLPVLDVFVLP